MDWIKEIEYKKYLNGDLKELEEIIGIELFIRVMKHFAKTSIYFSEKCINNMKVEYIRKNIGLMSDKELARKVGLSERMIYKIANEKHQKLNQIEMFENEK
jgi:ribosome-binding protein aMBF1 (putative translation factor)